MVSNKQRRDKRWRKEGETGQKRFRGGRQSQGRTAEEKAACPPKSRVPGEQGTPCSVPKKKYAIFFGYDGTQYHGMQKQIPGSPTADLPTVEGALEAALLKLGGFSQENLDHYAKLQWSRVGRTDKGVHAACQVVTCRLSLGPLSEEHKRRIEEAKLKKSEDEGDAAASADADAEKAIAVVQDPSDAGEAVKVEGLQRERELEFIQRLRQELPSDFVLYDVRRVPNHYDARLQCLKRQYEYCFPSYVLRPCVLQDNTEAVKTFFEEFCSDYEEPSETPYKDAFQSRSGDAGAVDWRSVLQSFDEKRTLFEALQAETATIPWDLANEGVLAPLVSRHRREMYAIRRAYAAFSQEKRSQVWVKIHGHSPVDSAVFSAKNDGADVDGKVGGVQYPELNYPPPELLAIKQPNMSKEEKTAHCMSEEDFTKFKAIIARFLGRHNWFSYTSRIKADDPSANRNIFAIEVHRSNPSSSNPSSANTASCEFIVVRLKGESFLYNQIRKMMSLAMEMMIGTAPSRAHAYVTTYPLMPKKHIHLAPGEGLMLERAYFETVNRPTREECPQMVIHHPIETEEPYGDQVRQLLDHPENLSLLSRASDEVFKGPSVPTANPLFDDDDDEKETAIKNDGEQEQIANESEHNSANSDDVDGLPVWYQVLKFKFQKLLPRMIEVFNEQDIFDVHVRDLSWHPFFAENFPVPRDTSYNNPTNRNE